MYKHRESSVTLLTQNTATLWQELNGAGSLRSSCELVVGVKDLVMSDRVLIIYLFPVLCLL
jgi:hypothetical protein